jgi:hypothetical protein
MSWKRTNNRDSGVFKSYLHGFFLNLFPVDKERWSDKRIMLMTSINVYIYYFLLTFIDYEHFWNFFFFIIIYYTNYSKN